MSRGAYALVGGTAVRISPLEITEPGTVYAEEGCAFNPVICDVSGALEARSETIRANGESTLAPSGSNIGFSSVSLTTEVYALKVVSAAPEATDGTYVFTAADSESNTVVGVCVIASGAVSESFGDGTFAVDSTGDTPVIAWTPSVTAESVTVWYAESVET